LAKRLPSGIKLLIYRLTNIYSILIAHCFLLRGPHHQKLELYVYVYVRSKKDFCITTNTPFRVQDLLTILNIKRTPRNVTGELQPLY